MNDVIANIREVMEALSAELVKVEKGNKSAARRARKHTLTLATLGKEFRKVSVKEMGGSNE